MVKESPPANTSTFEVLGRRRRTTVTTWRPTVSSVQCRRPPTCCVNGGRSSWSASCCSGSTRFGDLQRGIPGCPPATLSKRFRELDAAGVVRRVDGSSPTSYELTAAGWELSPSSRPSASGVSAGRASTYGADELDPDVLFWDVRRFLDPAGLGRQPLVVQFDVRGGGRHRTSYWAVVEHDAVDLCLIDPGREVHAVVDADLRTLTRIWMGDLGFDEGLRSGEVVLHGPRAATRRIPEWFGSHPVLAHVPPATAEAR